MRRVWRWAERNPLFWLHLLALGMSAWVLSWDIGPNKDVHIRALGTVLQAIGVATVAWDLIKTRRDFDEAGFVTSTWKWLLDFPNGPRLVIQASPAHSVAKGFPARIKQGHPPGISEIEQVRFELLQLDRAIDALLHRMTENQDAAENALAVHRSEVAKELRSVRGSIKNSMTSHSAMLGFGATWLLIGVILGTVAPEVLTLINSLR